MSSRHRELVARFGDFLEENDFNSRISMDKVGEVKALFSAKTIPVESEMEATAEAIAIDTVRRRDALRRTCNAVLQTREPEQLVDVGTIMFDEEERLAWKFLIGALTAKKSEILPVIEAELLCVAVDYHYATSRPELCDIFVHLSASEMFFIDGDSLFMAAISQQRVDWDLIQPLHVMYNAQKLLHDMQSRGANFQVVFFDSLLWIWESAPTKLFMRENLRQGLMALAKSDAKSALSVSNFSSYYAEEFEAHVRQWEPEFILISDGEQLGSLTPLQAFFVASTTANNTCETKQKAGDYDDEENPYRLKRAYRSIVEDEAVGNKAAMYYRCMHIWAATRRLKVGYSSRIMYKENAMIVFTVRVDGVGFERAVTIEHDVQVLAQSMEREVQLPVISSESLELLEEEELCYRERVVYAALHAYLRASARSEEEKQLCQTLALTTYVACYLNEKCRAQRVRPNTILADFLKQMSPFLLAVMRHAGCRNTNGQVFDIIDGHLFCVISQQLRTTAVCELLDEYGVEDVVSIWGAVNNEDGSYITNEPFLKLPVIQPLDADELQSYSLFTHELVERLAKGFGVSAHRADKPYPSGYGAANELAGWDITTPFDAFNDVTDAEGEAIAKSMMTDREAKRQQEHQEKFARNAFKQAESMGIGGFAAQELVQVLSDNEKDTETGGNGANPRNAGGKKTTKEHAGQRNKKDRKKEDEIREDTNVVNATSTVKEWCKQMDRLLRSVDTSHGRTTNRDRDEAISTIQAALKRLSQERFGRFFDPGCTLGDSTNTAIPLKLEMWRLLVGASQLREVEFAFATEDPALKDNKVTAKKTDVKSVSKLLHGFHVITQLVEWESSKGGKWGQLEPLRKAKPDMTTVEAGSYLRWVYLSFVELHIQLKLKCRVVKLLLENWRAERERARLDQESPRVALGIPLFVYCHHKVLAVIRDEGLRISSEDIDTVRSALRHFDLPDSYYNKLDQAIARWQSMTLGTLLPSLLPPEKQLFETPEMLQLIHMGHLLERPLVRKHDYRVAFNPDNWQRELLDIVDGRGSAVVCAPTSAGKTFISYYCMYRALRSSNKKVVVYLAPARALINQAVADVCARYGSKQYKNPGRHIYGVLGGADYHQFHDSCQVLLTVPETFETMLLSPKYKEWVELLDYVILDEIHSMESNGNGDVWERILALLPCPFVALSATLGETQQLCSWLNRVQGRLKEQTEEESGKMRDFEVHVLPREGKSIQRWNDIKKYIYLPPPGAQLTHKKIKAQYDNRYIRDLHPLSILTTDQLQRGFPPDISLVPSEVVSLFEKMNSTFNEVVLPKWFSLQLVQNMRAQLFLLEPGKYFETETYITQERARQYEAEVKNAFAYWAVLGHEGCESPDGLTLEEWHEFSATMSTVAEGILRAFAQKLNEDEVILERCAAEAMEKKKRLLLQQHSQQEEEKEPNKEEEAQGKDEEDTLTPISFPGSRQFIREHILNVLRELIARDMGPIIVFSFESEDCGDIVKYVVEQLEEAELRYRKTQEFAAYKTRIERAAAAQDARRKQRESTLKQKRLTTGDDGKVELADRGASDGEGEDELYVVPDILPEFTFLGDKCTVEAGVVNSLLEDCEDEGEDLLLRALKRGIGMHHAGVKGKLRAHVERLFRGRHCGVIFSTETLALGIHSPCRSVVLAGDHILLNPTQFRQMMGRAGRRGLDYLGHLVFLGITMRRIKRLMTSVMTVIKGNVQMDPMSNLRLLQLYDFKMLRQLKDDVVWKKHVFKLAERLFVNPLFFQGRDSVEGGNMESFTVEMLQMLLGFFQHEGLHFSDHTSSLGSLLQDVMYVFREAHVGNEGFAFIHMLTSGAFDKAHYPPVYDKKLNSGVVDEPVAELLAYLFSTHHRCGVPLEMHRSALLDPAVRVLWEGKTVSTQHRVVLSPIEVCSPIVSALDNTEFFALLSAFYNYLASHLPPQSGKELRLPCMNNTDEACLIFDNVHFECPLKEKLQESAVPYSARSPFVAISGCGDFFSSIDEVTFTLRDGLYCDRRLLPILDVVDGWRHDGAQILISACLLDFLRATAQIDTTRKNYRFTLLEELNGLSQSLSYDVLNRAEKVLSNLAGLVRKTSLPAAKGLTAIMPEKSEQGIFMAGGPRVLGVAERLNSLQPQIQKRLTEQLRAAKWAKMKK
ncbi:ATP-dependent DEAD/H RNA helicase [Trypanosoma rangeli]|uniref:ATP-dependent DEAD/H RNA helicase n=1 Tax=Trypanosoma rangeli TaxID=5698 RepID=A0A422MY32_TRYRA|nr:ATP-dependent DEAD/H RNA helicase [Trypanosoma rangeli]RNE98145.1 ATP-dependent DEAD/H RNA helicase [Trypanosoma rangeli]|eukprot:RNE98145.1 ATP-dependent DEAD/H RNA helicase [Trypanosoma rangeli]